MPAQKSFNPIVFAIVFSALFLAGCFAQQPSPSPAANETIAATPTPTPVAASTPTPTSYPGGAIEDAIEKALA